MVVIGIETATEVLSVAILHREKILAEYYINSSRNHSNLLLPTIESLVKKSKLKLDRLNLIAVSIGPGSFTGLRVGISLAKGLAFSLNIPLIGVPTLDALSEKVTSGSGEQHLICPILDAKKNQIYSALYRYKNKELKKLTEYLSIGFDDLCNLIDEIRKKNKENIIFTGEGVSIYREKLKERFSEFVSFVFDNQRLTNAVSIAKIGIERFKKGKCDSIYNLIPLYVRKPDVREY